MIKNFQNASHYFYHHPAVTMFDKTFGLQTTEKVAPTGLEPLRVSKLRAPPPQGQVAGHCHWQPGGCKRRARGFMGAELGHFLAV